MPGSEYGKRVSKDSQWHLVDTWRRPEAGVLAEWSAGYPAKGQSESPWNRKPAYPAPRRCQIGLPVMEPVRLGEYRRVDNPSRISEKVDAHRQSIAMG